MEPEYYVDIRAEITATDSKGVPLAGEPIRVEMQKTHCGGKLGPKLVAEGITNADGIYEPYMTWSFKMNNSRDFITINGLGFDFFYYMYYYTELKQYSGSTFIFKHKEIRPSFLE